jgi:hypothetical protein
MAELMRKEDIMMKGREGERVAHMKIYIHLPIKAIRPAIRA